MNGGSVYFLFNFFMPFFHSTCVVWIVSLGTFQLFSRDIASIVIQRIFVTIGTLPGGNSSRIKGSRDEVNLKCLLQAKESIKWIPMLIQHAISSCLNMISHTLKISGSFISYLVTNFQTREKKMNFKNFSFV